MLMRNEFGAKSRINYLSAAFAFIRNQAPAVELKSDLLKAHN